MNLTPCNNCPWRKNAPAEYWDPEHFRSIYETCRADGMHVMLCHKANRPDGTRDEKLFCRGWVSVMKFESIGVRLLAIGGGVKAADVNAAATAGLFPTFEAMMRANRVRCRRGAGRILLPKAEGKKR